jgi:hypothetical protein
MRAHHRKAEAKPKAEKPKVGRPEIPVDENVVRRLAQAGVPVTDISHIVGLSRTRLYERFGTLLDKSAAEGSVSLRIKQHALALNGNVTMLVWLGKNRLGQTDKQEVGGPNGQRQSIEIHTPMSQAERDAEMKEMLRALFERTARDDPEFARVWKVWLEWSEGRLVETGRLSEHGPVLLRAGGQR